MRPRHVLLLLLIAVTSLGLVDGVTFAPRTSPGAGAAWSEQSTWHTTGHTVITVGGLTVRDKPIDSLSHYAATVQVDAVTDDKPTDLTISFVEQVTKEDGAADELGLDGVAVRILGLPGDREFSRADGSRLKRPQKQWLTEQFGGSAEDQGINPLHFLLRDGPVVPGTSWDMDLAAIAEYFDTSRFRFDADASAARATLESVGDWHGLPTGHFTFDVLLIPSWIKDGTIREASMHIVGSADLPLEGGLPWMAFAVESDLRFDGTVKRRGIKADVDLAMTFAGKEAQLPLH